MFSERKKCFPVLLLLLPDHVLIFVSSALLKHLRSHRIRIHVCTCGQLVVEAKEATKWSKCWGRGRFGTFIFSLLLLCNSQSLSKLHKRAWRATWRADLRLRCFFMWSLFSAHSQSESEKRRQINASTNRNHFVFLLGRFLAFHCLTYCLPSGGKFASCNVQFSAVQCSAVLRDWNGIGMPALRQ